MEAVILVGIQGSGKTTFYRERFSETHVRISLDMLRSRARSLKLMQTCLETQQRFVVDNTNVLATERAAYIQPARNAGFRVIGYYFRPNLRRALKWNSLRGKGLAIPVPGVIGTYKKLQPPAPEEGFDELYVVDIDANNRFVTSPWPGESPPESE
jgi:predicted kinase